MYTTPIIILLLTTLVEARFGQEHPKAIQDIASLSDSGKPGLPATIAGNTIGDLLAAANPCEKLKDADEIIEKLGDSPENIAAARELTAAEINFNPFATSTPSICADPSLPKTEALRGVVPLIDPAVGGSDLENKNSAESVKTPFDAKDLSQADVMVAHGFTNFTAVKADGTKVEATSLDSAKTSDGASANSVDKQNDKKEENEKAEDDSKASSAASSTDDKKNDSKASSADSSTDDKKNDSKASSAASSTDDKKNDSKASSAASSTDDKKNDSKASSAASSTDDKKNDSKASSAASSTDDKKNDSKASSAASSTDDKKNDSKASNAASSTDKDSSNKPDFGKCTPTMVFQAGVNGRKATEFTFQASDPLVSKGQQEALNPNIIANRIKDQLTNVCEANQAAKDLAIESMTKLSASGLKDVKAAELWNESLGFKGADTDPDNAP